MSEYIATFYAHIHAVRFSRFLKSRGLKAVMAPVPRRVSSSCGTCVRFYADGDEELHSEDIEKLYRLDGETLTLLYEN